MKQTGNVDNNVIQSDVSSHYIMENRDRSCQTHDALLLERRKHLLLGVFRAREAALLETTASFHFARCC